jgi:phytoene synthase
MTAALQRSYRRAERTTAAWARSFHFASRFLPLDKKRAIFALYDYCRHADNLVDERGDRPVSVVREDLAGLAREVTALHAGAAPSTERWLALAHTLQRYPVPLEPLLQLLDGVAMDLEPVGIQDFAMLHQYCRHVAGGVGLMLGPVLGAAPVTFREAGVRLGIAMQLTNVLRDVGEDAASGRVYLAREDREACGVARDALRAEVRSEPLAHLLSLYAARARARYAEAQRALPAELRRRLRPAQAMGAIYRELLDALERRDFPLHGPALRLSKPRRMAIAAREWLGIGAGAA